MLKNWLHALKTQTRNQRRVSVSRLASLEVLEQRSLLSATLAPDCCDQHELEGVDAAGNEYHALPRPRSGATTPATGDSGTVAAALDVSQTFLLHSNSAANHVVYLDFDGSVASGTSWNSGFTAGADIVTPAYDFDGNVAAFSTAELERIQYIWQRVSEDFAPFNVNVTTQEPGIEALRKTSTSDTQWGIRVAIGGNGSWYGSAGGVAYIGSFNWNSDTPTYVFEDNLGNGHEKYTAEAISHEVGHTLGLNHDGTATTGYYEGQGTGATGWAPIMGVGYYRELSQWSKGEYTGANQLQDDLAIITTQNGFNYRTDLAGDSTGTATAATINGTTASASGVIERTSDLDVFSFTTGAGAVSFTVSPFTRSPNLDIEAKLLDSTGTVVATANPIGALGASVSATVPAGQYFLQIDGVGEGSPTATGYSDYGSLGQYSFTGTIVGAAALPTLSVQDATATEAGTLSFRIALSAAAADPVTVNFATANGTALSGSDYVAGSGTVTFAPGETEKFVTVSVIDDTTVESTETLLLNLSGASANAAISDGQAQGTITDNDVAPPPPARSLSINDISTVEGNLTQRGAAKITRVIFTVTLSQASTTSVKVNWASSNGTATSGSDYTAASGLLTFKAGQVSQTISIDVRGDTAIEADESFSIVLSGPIGAIISDGTGVCTIFNDDGTSAGSIAEMSSFESSATQALPQSREEFSSSGIDATTPTSVSAEAPADAAVTPDAPKAATSAGTAAKSERRQNADATDDTFAQLESLMGALSA